MAAVAGVWHGTSGQPAWAQTPAAATSGLLARWPLRADARDHASGGHHGRAMGVRFRPDAPRNVGGTFADGATVEVPHGPALELGAAEFSIAAWIRLDAALDDVPGDVISKYDPARRRGFHLGVARRDAATSGQSNACQLEFGIDDGRLDPSWTDCGRPGQAVLVFCLTVHDHHLYAATCEPGAGQAGHVYRYAGEARWIDCGSPGPANSVTALAVHDGRLYAATGRYRLRGSALAESPNQALGGSVYRFEAPGEWTDCGRLPEVEAINGLTTYRGHLVASSLYSPGVFRYEGQQRWTPLGTPGGRRVEALAVYRGALFGTGYDAGEVYRYTPDEGWRTVGTLPGVTQTYGFVVHQGKLHTSTWPDGSVYRYEADNEWTHLGRLGDEKEVMPMSVYNGKLFAGTLPLAAVFRLDAPGQWTNLGRLDTTPDVTYRRVWSMAVFDGMLYGGTLPSGHVQAIRAGRSVTLDERLAGDWRHLAAVRQPDRLALYVDGKLAASSAPFAASDYNLSNDAPLRIGWGEIDHFHGQLRDVRLYGRALTADEAAELAADRP